jgi:hypothetical protein
VNAREIGDTERCVSENQVTKLLKILTHLLSCRWVVSELPEKSTVDGSLGTS